MSSKHPDPALDSVNPLRHALNGTDFEDICISAHPSKTIKRLVIKEWTPSLISHLLAVLKVFSSCLILLKMGRLCLVHEALLQNKSMLAPLRSRDELDCSFLERVR